MTELATDRDRYGAAVRLALLMGAASAAFFSCYTLRQPYFLDTFGYVSWIDAHAVTGVFPSDYRLANTYLYYLPVRWLGAVGVTVTMVAVITLFTAVYVLVLARDFRLGAAGVATLLLLSAPTSLIAVTHLKEDYNSLLFLAIALVLLRRDATWGRSIAAGACFGLALLLKEFAVALLPVVWVYLHIRHNDIRSYRALLDREAIARSAPRLAVFTAAALAACWLVAPHRLRDYTLMLSSPNMGQFLGPLSSLQRSGYRFWEEAILHLSPFYGIALVAVIAAGVRRRLVPLLYFAAAVLLFVILSNTTVTRARHYPPVLFFLAPLIADGLWLASRPLASPRLRLASVWVVAGGIAVWQTRDVLPTLEYRMLYDPHAEFFQPLAQTLPAGALLLGMDGCGIANYYTGLECRQHPVDPDPRQVDEFVRLVRDESGRRAVFLLPDGLAYDAPGGLRARLESDFELVEVFSRLSEDYHAMTYGLPVAAVADQVLEEHPACHLANESSDAVEASPRLQLERVQYSFRCGGAPLVRRVYAYRGYRTFLVDSKVYELRPRGTPRRLSDGNAVPAPERRGARPLSRQRQEEVEALVAVGTARVVGGWDPSQPIGWESSPTSRLGGASRAEARPRLVRCASRP